MNVFLDEMGRSYYLRLSHTLSFSLMVSSIGMNPQTHD